jgi:hypothetical protein
MVWINRLSKLAPAFSAEPAQAQDHPRALE